MLYVGRRNRMGNFYLLMFVAAFSLNLNAQGNAQRQLKPYIVVSGPVLLQELRVNIENYTPNSKIYHRSEINFGDGSVVSSLKDAYHNFAANGSYSVTVNTWDSANVLTTYSEIVDINSTYQIKDIPQSTVTNILNVQAGKHYDLAIVDTMVGKLFKLTLTKTPVPLIRRTFPCRTGTNVNINGLTIFKATEFNSILR